MLEPGNPERDVDLNELRCGKCVARVEKYSSDLLTLPKISIDLTNSPLEETSSEVDRSESQNPFKCDIPRRRCLYACLSCILRNDRDKVGGG